MRPRSAAAPGSALPLQGEGVLVDLELDLLAIHLHLGLREVLVVHVRGLEQPPHRELERLEPVGRDLAVVLRGLRAYRDDPEQPPRVPTELQPAVLADTGD